MRGLLLFLVLISGCDSLYYKDMDGSLSITVVEHTDAGVLASVCGWDNSACSIRIGSQCTIHLPERAGYALDHEVTHCYGRTDPPREW